MTKDAHPVCRYLRGNLSNVPHTLGASCFLFFFAAVVEVTGQEPHPSVMAGFSNNTPIAASHADHKDQVTVLN